MKWSITDIQKIRKLAAEGKTSSQISAHFKDATRNAIMGLCHRNNIQLSGRKPPLMGSVPRAARPSPPRLLKPKNNPIKKAIPKYEDLPMPYVPGNKTLLTVGYFDCRAILGPTNGVHTVYCGAIVVPGKSWCAHHMSIYTVPNQTQQRRSTPNEQQKTA